jgi:hypothetical protein
MTWMHWVLFVVLSLFALGLAFDKSQKTNTRFVSFVIFVGMILLLVLGQRN